jgi:hypothetical protein
MRLRDRDEQGCKLTRAREIPSRLKKFEFTAQFNENINRINSAIEYKIAVGLIASQGP